MLDVRNISKQYYNEKIKEDNYILKNITFEINNIYIIGVVEKME